METTSERPIIQARGLGFRRGERWIFRNLDLDIYPGEFVALVGPSGVGKSTLLGCLCGYLQPFEGTVAVDIGAESSNEPQALRRHFGVVYQELELTLNADLLTNVLCGRLGRLNCLRTLFGFPKYYRSEAYRLLEDLGVGTDPTKWAAQMSGGERQRVAIARALFQEPEIYFADEPVSSLDAYYAGRVLGMLRQEADRKQRAVLCVLHNAEHIQRFADMTVSLNVNDPSAHRIRRIRSSRKEAQA